jgi:hypothetical protein
MKINLFQKHLFKSASHILDPYFIILLAEGSQRCPGNKINAGPLPAGLQKNSKYLKLQPY